MFSRSKLERETIILFNEAEDTVEVYTHNTKLQNRLNKFRTKYPELVSVEGITYTLPKKSLRIHPVSPLSEAQLERARQIAKQNLQKRGV